MGWSNQQATNLDGQAFSYTNTTIEFGAATTVTFADGGGMTATGAPVDFTSGSEVTLDDSSDITVAGYSLPRGIVARAVSSTDLPAFGTTAGDPNVAATVLSVSCPMVAGRVYLISAPSLSVRMNVDNGTTGVQFTYTTDGSAPGPSSARLVSQTVFCRHAGVPELAAFGATYVPDADGTLKVLLSIWQIGTDATTASGGDHGGDPAGLIELLIEDKGVAP